MGQHADDILDGSCCALCGLYFTNNNSDIIPDHGYPVACESCHDNECGYDKSLFKTM